MKRTVLERFQRAEARLDALEAKNEEDTERDRLTTRELPPKRITLEQITQDPERYPVGSIHVDGHCTWERVATTQSAWEDWRCIWPRESA